MKYILVPLDEIETKFQVAKDTSGQWATGVRDALYQILATSKQIELNEDESPTSTDTGQRCEYELIVEKYFGKKLKDGTVEFEVNDNILVDFALAVHQHFTNTPPTAHTEELSREGVQERDINGEILDFSKEIGADPTNEQKSFLRDYIIYQMLHAQPTQPVTREGEVTAKDHRNLSQQGDGC